MLLFRIAPKVTASPGGIYIGTDICQAGLNYCHDIIANNPVYKPLAGLVETHKIAADETLNVCDAKSNDVVLCNGVTMYFPSTSYLLKCMQTAVDATADGGFAIFGDVQSKRHRMFFHIDVHTFQALRRDDATAKAVLVAPKKQLQARVFLTTTIRSSTVSNVQAQKSLETVWRESI